MKTAIELFPELPKGAVRAYLTDYLAAGHLGRQAMIKGFSSLAGQFEDSKPLWPDVLKVLLGLYQDRDEARYSGSELLTQLLRIASAESTLGFENALHGKQVEVLVDLTRFLNGQFHYDAGRLSDRDRRLISVVLKRLLKVQAIERAPQKRWILYQAFYWNNLSAWLVTQGRLNAIPVFANKLGVGLSWSNWHELPHLGGPNSCASLEITINHDPRSAALTEMVVLSRKRIDQDVTALRLAAEAQVLKDNEHFLAKEKLEGTGIELLTLLAMFTGWRSLLISTDKTE